MKPRSLADRVAALREWAASRIEADCQYRERATLVNDADFLAAETAWWRRFTESRPDWQPVLPILADCLGGLDDAALYELRTAQPDAPRMRFAAMLADYEGSAYAPVEPPVDPITWLERGHTDVALVLLGRAICEYQNMTGDHHPGAESWATLDRVPGSHRLRPGRPRPETPAQRFERLLAAPALPITSTPEPATDDSRAA